MRRADEPREHLRRYLARRVNAADAGRRSGDLGAMTNLASSPTSEAVIQSKADAEELAEAQAMAQRGDRYFIVGCIVCGTWLLGPIGVIILAYGMLLMRRAERQGATIRPWAITLIGGFILVDTSVNFFAWGFDLFPAHDSVLGRSLWMGY